MTPVTATPIDTAARSCDVTPRKEQMPRNRAKRKLFTSADPMKSRISSFTATHLLSSYSRRLRLRLFGRAAVPPLRRLHPDRLDEGEQERHGQECSGRSPHDLPGGEPYRHHPGAEDRTGGHDLTDDADERQSPSETESVAEGVTQGRHRFHPGKRRDRKSTRLNSSHVKISYAVF